MAGHQFPQITSQDGSSLHAGDRYSNITSHGPLLMFGNNAVDTKSLLKQLQQVFVQNYQPHEADVLGSKIEEINRRIQDLESSRPTQEIIAVKPTASAGDITNKRGIAAYETDDSIMKFKVQFVVRVEVALVKSLITLYDREVRFIIDLNSSHRGLIHTIHIKCNGGTGNYDANFPIRWSKWKGNYGLVMRFCVYLERGWTFVDEEEFHYGPVEGTSSLQGSRSEKGHYCVAKFVNQSDDDLDLVTANNVHQIERLVQKCYSTCCAADAYYE
ncbi:hypothetical protein LTS08_006194 [Lithohypha guttulata]|nr:hypothetical protein LTS08_006194 [Lithohypha guttulata]